MNVRSQIHSRTVDPQYGICFFSSPLRRLQIQRWVLDFWKICESLVQCVPNTKYPWEKWIYLLVSGKCLRGNYQVISVRKCSSHSPYCQSHSISVHYHITSGSFIGTQPKHTRKEANFASETLFSSEC